MKINIEQRHIDKATSILWTNESLRMRCCPVSQALKEQFNTTDVYTLEDNILVYIAPGKCKKFDMSLELMEMVHKYDANFTFVPGEYEICEIQKSS